MRQRKYCTYIIFIISVFIFFMSSPVSYAAIYYIDYSTGNDSNNGLTKTAPWMRCPGMVGFSGNYTHQAGDIFIFKGGVTWPSSTLPLTISYSGSAVSCDLASSISTCDQYTVDYNWYSGSAWSRPVFDGARVQEGIYAYEKSYYIVDNIKIVNNGTPSDSKSGLVVTRPHFVEIKNLYIESGTKLCMNIADGASDNKSTIRIHDSTLKNCFKQLFFNGERTTGTIDDLQIYNMNFAGNNVLVGGESHSNIIHIKGFGPPTRSGYSFTNLKIYNNKVSGNYPYGATAWIFVEEAVDGALIYNNVLGFDNTTDAMSGYMGTGIMVEQGINIKVYNNTISSAGNSNSGKGFSSGIAFTQGANNYDIKNNIIYKTYIGIVMATGCTSCTSDHNLIYLRPGGIYGQDSTGKQYSTWSGWQGAGHDYNGINSDPKFTNITASPFNLKLRLDSPAIKTGYNFRILYQYDALGEARPDAMTWDLGAYQRSNTSLTAPRNIRLGN